MKEKLKSLAGLYLGCVQEEGLRRLTLKESRRGQAFIAPSLGRERLLREDPESLLLEDLSRQKRRFLEF